METRDKLPLSLPHRNIQDDSTTYFLIRKTITALNSKWYSPFFASTSVM